MARLADPKELVPKVVERPVDLRPLVEGMIRAIQNLELPAPQVQVSTPSGIQPKVEVTMPEPIRQWVFTVQRDKDGFIKTITARAE